MTFNMDPKDIYMTFPIKCKSGRTWIITPDGSDPVFEKVCVDNTIFKALVKAHLWQREIKCGKYTSIRNLAAKKNIDESYVRRVMNMNYLSPKIKEMIIVGKFPRHFNLQDILYNIPLFWDEQEKLYKILR